MKRRRVNETKYRNNIFLKNKYLLILLCVTIIPKVIIAVMQNPIQVSDEVGTLAAPAYFAGLNWNDVLGRVSYYGTGFHFLFAPLFRLTNNPYIIYRIILVSYVLIEALGGVIVYHLCEKYLVKDNQKLSCLLGIMIVYAQYNKDTAINNEPVIFLLIWVVALLFFKLYEVIDNKKKKFWFTVALCLVLAYSLTIHTRMLALWALVIGIELYVAICKKKSLVSISTFVLVGAVGYFVAQIYNGWIQDVVWLQNMDSTYLHNSSAMDMAGRLSYIAKLNSKLYFHAFLNVIVGQIDTMNVMTMGLFVLALVIGVCIVCRTLKDRTKYDWLLGSGMLAAYGIAGSLGMLLLQAITWLNRAVESMEYGYGAKLLTQTEDYSKTFTYLRYFAPFVGPVLLVAIVYMYRKRIWKAYIVSFVITILGQIYWVKYIVKLLLNNISSVRVYIPFSWSNYMQESSWRVIIPGSVILILVFAIMGVLIRNNKILLLMVMLCSILIYQYIYYGIVHENEWTMRADAGYEIITALEEELDFEKELVVPYKTMAYTYQVMFNDYHIEMDMPDETENALIITNRFSKYQYDEYLLEYGYTAFKLDENEYLYVRDADIIKVLDQWGCKRFSLMK